MPARSMNQFDAENYDFMRGVAEVSKAQLMCKFKPGHVCCDQQLGLVVFEKTKTSSAISTTAVAPTFDVVAAQRKDERVVDWSTAMDVVDGDTVFFVELLGDLMDGRQKVLSSLEHAIETNDHKSLCESSDCLRDAAINLALPALAHDSLCARLLGSALASQPERKDYLDARSRYLASIRAEYKRVEAFLPVARERAAEQAAAHAAAEAEAGVRNRDPSAMGAYDLLLLQQLVAAEKNSKPQQTQQTLQSATQQAPVVAAPSATATIVVV